MSKHSYVILTLVGVLGLLFVLISFREYKSRQINSDQTYLKAKYFSDNDFYEGKIKAESVKSEYSGNKIYGGIIPHHLLPGYILSDFFTKLALQNPKRIILIGPNHYEIGGEKPITSIVNWETKFGKLDSDYESIDSLIKEGVLAQNDNVALSEHSIGGILHYIKYYIPDAKVVPVILSSATTPEEISSLSESIHKYIDDDTVVIASVDFSHYLSNPEAQINDKVTKKIMQLFDYENLYRLNNDYVDSPQSIGLLLNLMQRKDAENLEFLFNTNSGEILNNDTIQTTSYFSVFFTK